MKSVREFGQELPYGGLKYQACTSRSRNPGVRKASVKLPPDTVLVQVSFLIANRVAHT